MNTLNSFWNQFKKQPEIYRRVVAGSQYDLRLDGLRFLAILSVVLCHIANHTQVYGHLAPKGQSFFWEIVYNLFQGVSLFFVLSAYLLSSYLFRIPIRAHLKKYFKRRFFRIVPTYWIVLTICTIVHLFVIKDINLELGTKFSLMAYTFSNNIFLPGEHPFMMPIGWTVEIEIQFYLVLPFFILIYKKYRQLGRLMAVLIILFWSLIFGQFEWYLHTSAIFHFPYFTAGILMADLMNNDTKKEKKLALPLWLSYLIGIALIFIILCKNWYYIRIDQFKFDPAPMLFLILLWLVLTQKFLKGFMTNPWIAFIGSMAYSIYLMHMLVISFAGKILLQLHIGDGFLNNLILQTVLLLPIILATSYLFYRLVEYPFMNYGLKIKQANEATSEER